MSNAVPMATGKQIGFIHGLAGRLKMDEDTRRLFLKRETGVESCKLLTAAQADRVINRLRELSAGVMKAQGAVAGLDTAAASKLRALWIAAWNLGLVRDRTDRAMLAFLERQTGVSHTRFLREPGAAAPAIEALKSWLARDGKVEWPADAGDAIANKRAVLDGQWRRLLELGEVQPFAGDPLFGLNAYAFRVVGMTAWRFFEPAHYDLVQAALGRKLRGALARRQEAETHHAAA